MKKRNRGYSLIELGLALAAGAVLTTVIIATLRGVNESRRDQDVLSQLTFLAQAATAFARTGSVPEVGVEGDLIAAGRIPSDWVDARDAANPRLVGPWGGQIQMDTVYLLGTGAYPDAVDFHAGGMTPSACARILMLLAPSAVLIAEGSAAGAAFKDAAGTLETTQARAIETCDGASAKTYTIRMAIPQA